MFTTIALISQKGGAGKTTIATNLAAAAHLDGKRTLLVDTDPQGSALDWYHARQDGSQLDGLNVVRFERPLTLRKLETLAEGYDAVVIDTPPKLGDQARNAAVLADVVLIPVEPAYFSLWAVDFTNSLLDSADQIRAQLDRPSLLRRMVLNKADERTRATKLARESIGNHACLLDATLHQRTAFVLASGFGEAVLTAEPAGAAADEVRELYAQLGATWSANIQPSAPKGASPLASQGSLR